MKIEMPDSYEFNPDMQIAHVIVESVAALKGKGYPCNLTAEEWDAILDEIVDGFKEFLDNYFGENFDEDKFSRAQELLNEWFLSLWW